MFMLATLWKGRKKEKDCALPAQDEYRQYLEADLLRGRITEADLDTLSLLPPGLDYNEWLATHTISFFEHINLLYGTVSEYCTSTGCTTMNGPANTQYLWFDEKGKKCKCPAPQYVDYVMTFIQKTIGEDTIFPTKFDQVFPSSFESIVKKIHRLLFHVIAHIYHAHYRDIVNIGLHGHLNSIFHHFMIFIQRFNLLEDKEVDIMMDLFRALQNSQLDNNENKENRKVPYAGTPSGDNSGQLPVPATAQEAKLT